ncbi:MAG: hypothetical protein Q8M71_11390 [Thermodesulfovibrionales bacterium]|nr:hypothetical protein [Thermodesulfovibrionales bacterium]
MINEKAIKTYLSKKFRNVSQIKIRKLGSGVVGENQGRKGKT